MKHIALNSTHESLGAKMIPFAGYNMPVQYEGVTVEHDTVRKALGIFDVSHMGEFFAKGEQVVDLLQKVCSNDVSKVKVGQAQYNCLPNEDGGIVDDLIIYRLRENEFLLVVNASNIEKDWAWVNKHNDFGVELEDASDGYSLFAVQGPKAVESLQKLTEIDLKSIKFYHFEQGKMAGIDDVIISATGYTGSGGFELYCKNKDAEQLWNKVMEAGEAHGIKPIGLAARDTLRLEMGYCLYGNDIDETTSPIEANLGWITKFTKDFINSKNLKEQKETGPKRKLVGFELEGRGIPRQGYDILDEKGDHLGIVTSGTKSPSLNKGIGMGYVPPALAKPGSKIFVQVRKNTIPATVVKLPFYKG